MKNRFVSSLVSICLLANSVSLAAQEAKKETLQQAKGAHQIIDEARKLLWSNAYRIDKELISTTDSYSNSTSYSISSTRGDTSSSEGRLINGIVGGILGGGFAGLAGHLLGAGNLGTMGMVAAGAAGGALVGGGKKSSSASISSESSSSSSTSSESHSRTYQIHEKANTWGIIIMDVEGYEKAKEKIMNTVTAQNSCVRQGIAFLDAVSTYKVMDAKKINRLSKLIDQLQEARTQQAILLDQGKGSNQTLNNIDAFTDQRVSAIRIDWQKYLNGISGKCVVSAQWRHEVDQLNAQLIERFNNSVSAMPQNSMNHLGALSFSSAPYKKSSPEEVAALSFVKTRAMINQVKTLRQLQDKGYIQFIRTGISVNGDKSGNVLLEVTPKALKKINGFSSGIPYKIDQSSPASQSLALSVGGGFFFMGVFAGIGEMLSPLADIGINGAGRDVSSLLVTGLIIGGYGVSLAISEDQGKKYNIKQAEQAAVQILSEKSFNDSVNRSILANEELYDLQARQNYRQQRSRLISEFKTILAHEVVNTLISNKDIKHWESNLSYIEFLKQRGLVTSEEFASTAIILDFLSGKKIYLRDVDEAFVLKNQMKGLQVSLALLLQDSGLKENDRQEITALKVKLDREISGLDLLNK